MNKYLKGFTKLGLDIKTGYSPVITLESIENETNTKLTGNGSIIRRDSKPWCYFNMENIKGQANSVYAYKFNGYLTKHQERQLLLDQIASTYDRAQKEELKCKKRLETLAKLAGDDDMVLYSMQDVL